MPFAARSVPIIASASPRRFSRPVSGSSNSENYNTFIFGFIILAILFYIFVMKPQNQKKYTFQNVQSKNKRQFKYIKL